jgi:hypothetical protein
VWDDDTTTVKSVSDQVSSSSHIRWIVGCSCWDYHHLTHHLFRSFQCNSSVTMGAAHCSVVNQTSQSLAVITFNMADLVYTSYHTMYIIEPGGVQVVEANPDAIGLKLGIIFEAKRFKQELTFFRFTCQNDSILTVTSIGGGDIDYYGDGTNLQGKNVCRETDVQAYNLAADALQVELAQVTDRPAHPVAEEAKKLMSSIKMKSEEVMTKVTGREISLDFPKMSQHSQLGRSNSFVSSSGTHSVGDENAAALTNSSVGSGSRSMLPNSSDSTKGAAAGAVLVASSSSSNLNANNNLASRNSQSQRLAPSTKGPGPSVSARPSLTGGSSTLNQPPSPPLSPGSLLSQPNDEHTTTVRFEEELERLRKEKKWEQEIERVRRERQQRIELEQDFQQHPEHFPELRPVDSVKVAPVVEQNACSVCVVS